MAPAPVVHAAHALLDVIGSAASLADPGPGSPAQLDADGVLRWQLTVTAWRSESEPDQRSQAGRSARP